MSSASSPSSSFTVSIGHFKVSQGGWKCSCYTPLDFAEMVDEELATCCKQNGLKVVEGAADVRIQGMIVKVDEGNQALRYIMPGLGASTVQIKGTITTRGDEEPEEFRQSQNGYLGLFGGNSKVMLQQAVHRAALIISRDAHDLANPNAARTGGAGRYFLIAAGIALAVAVLVGIGAFAWSQTIPQTNNSIKPAEKLPWALFVAATCFAAIGVGSVAVAPLRVLEDRSMLWLQTVSGVRSMTAVRVLMFVFAAIPAALCLLSFFVAKGS